MKRGDEIELSSDEEGFKGSWFRAILKDPLPKSGNKRLNVSLLANDGSSSTTQKTTYRRFLRPIPPESLFTAAAEFEEGCVVEASRGGGWWTGAVVKKINDEEVWVYFDSPPDLLQFKTGQLRQHFDWVKQEWVRPQNKVFVSKKSTFRCGTMVEVKVDEDVEAGIVHMVSVFYGIKQNSLDVWCSPRHCTLLRPLSEHLYIFEFKVDVTSDELCFEFTVDKKAWMIKECGVHYVNTS